MCPCTNPVFTTKNANCFENRVYHKWKILQCLKQIQQIQISTLDLWDKFSVRKTTTWKRQKFSTTSIKISEFSEFTFSVQQLKSKLGNVGNPSFLKQEQFYLTLQVAENFLSFPSFRFLYKGENRQLGNGNSLLLLTKQIHLTLQVFDFSITRKPWKFQLPQTKQFHLTLPLPWENFRFSEFSISV